MFVAGIEIKTSDKHVEAAINVVTGLGFKSPRLQLDSMRIIGFCQQFCHQSIANWPTQR